MALGSASGQTVSVSESGSAHHGRALTIVTTLFFMWGFLTALNDTLIPHLKQIFDLNYTQAMLVQLAFFGSYFVFSIPSAKLIEAIGYKRTMVVGLAVMAFGVFLFLPAASVPSYPFFLAAQIILAAGVTALQVAANPYVTVLGPANTASSRLNLTQAFNSLGTTIAPYFGSALILAGAAELANMTRKQQAESVKMPYAGIGIALVLLAIAIALVHLPRLQTTQEFRTTGSAKNPLGSIWEHHHVWLGAIGIFTYVGAEVAIGSFLINYMGSHDLGSVPAATASKLVALYWGGAMVGRFIGVWALRRVPTGRAVGVCAIITGLLLTTSMLTNGHVAIVSILMIGLFNSIMFPSIFTLGTAHMGPLTGKASGLLVMAIVGGAIIPVIQGAIADKIGIHHCFILPLLCYMFIVFYGFIGSRPTGTSADLVAT
ncbi:MAG TPA: sugar MFS transporter [Acidobacteriaceae bacterium]|jgi:FHS family L-fucose permease-like MFS transporter|nr:sugar MFS transporter [Acidobacteriaceae bacterium]